MKKFALVLFVFSLFGCDNDHTVTNLPPSGDGGWWGSGDAPVNDPSNLGPGSVWISGDVVVNHFNLQRHTIDNDSIRSFLRPVRADGHGAIGGGALMAIGANFTGSSLFDNPYHGGNVNSRGISNLGFALDDNNGVVITAFRPVHLLDSNRDIIYPSVPRSQLLWINSIDNLSRLVNWLHQNPLSHMSYTSFDGSLSDGRLFNPRMEREFLSTKEIVRFYHVLHWDGNNEHLLFTGWFFTEDTIIDGTLFPAGVEVHFYHRLPEGM